MRKIPVVSSDEKLNRIISLECARFEGEFSPVFYKNQDEVIEVFKYELPEIKILYFSDPEVDCLSILREIQDDPWLHYGGIIAIHNAPNEKDLLEELRDANIIAVLKARDFAAGFPRLLRIIRQNKQILFQRGIQQHLLKDISGSLVMENDPLDVTTYTNLITNYLYNANLIGRDEKEKLHVALLELLINAIEHGQLQNKLRREVGLPGKGRGHHVPYTREEQESRRQGQEGLSFLHHRARKISLHHPGRGRGLRLEGPPGR